MFGRSSPHSSDSHSREQHDIADVMLKSHLQMSFQAAVFALAVASAPAASALSSTKSGMGSLRATFRTLQQAGTPGTYSGHPSDVDPINEFYIRAGHPNDGNEGNEGNEGKLPC